ncbi:MAG: mechanosensitive ion channel [Pedobacter sp.]|nr:MAG: mechanosensitive ion channel [Pedobacter sp.]
MIQFSYFLRITLLLLWVGTGTIVAQNRVLSDTSNTIPDTLLFRIQKAQSILIEVNANNKKGYNLGSINVALNEIQANIKPLHVELQKKYKEIDNKNLQNYELILKDSKERLTRIRNSLIKSSNELQKMSEQVLGLSNDTILKVPASQADERQLYQKPLQDIHARLQQSGELTGKNIAQVGKLLAEVSTTELLVNDLLNITIERLQQSGKQALFQEVPVIWKDNWVTLSKVINTEQIKSALLVQQQIVSYFLNASWDKRLITLIFAITFFLWVNRNFKLANRPGVVKKIGDTTFQYLKPFPILATGIVVLNSIPLLESGAPSIYIECLFLILLVITILFLKRIKGSSGLILNWWIQLGIAYAILVFLCNLQIEALIFRLALMVLNAFFIYLGFNFYKKLSLPQFPKQYRNWILWLFIAFNIISLLFNLFGRLSLAKAFVLTGVIGLIQFFVLTVFIQLMSDALELQLKISACSKGFFSRISHNRARASSKKIWRWVAIALWIIVFLINMNLTATILHFLENALVKERGFGSFNFTFGNILFFLFIIFIANKLQKNVPILFGEGTVSYEGELEQKSSKVALIRLIIIVIALLLALTASGLPMDRVTVVLGALGVGIGLGMQNIVNNFVSGIILIFEKPFRIGDFIELADKKGRVKDIGIRSSKLLTHHGSEVIIPNGDLLAGRLVNWTLNHDYVKTELLFKVAHNTDIDQLEKIIKEEIKKVNHHMQQLQTEILVNAITAEGVEIKLLTWVENIFFEPQFKSALMSALLKRFKAAEIKVA